MEWIRDSSTSLRMTGKSQIQLRLGCAFDKRDRMPPPEPTYASPFPPRKKPRDLIGLVIWVVAAVAFVAFIVSMIAVFMMHAAM
jgi:hypothetical protein